MKKKVKRERYRFESSLNKLGKPAGRAKSHNKNQHKSVFPGVFPLF